MATSDITKPLNEALQRRITASGGQLAYAAYCRKAETTWDGKPLPTWDQLSSKTQAAWTASAQTVLAAVLTAQMLVEQARA